MTLEELKLKQQWVVWKYKVDEKTGNKTKVPYSALGVATGTNEKYRSTWTTYNISKENVLKYDGIGLIFDNGVCGVDIDKRSADDEITKEIIELFDSYTEYSPSLNGFHILFTVDKNKLPTIDDGTKLDPKYYMKNPHNQLECYIDKLTNRYFTFTEKKYADKPINERTEQLLKFLDKYMIKSEWKPQKTTNNNIKSNPIIPKSDYKSNDEYLKIGLEKDKVLIELWNSTPSGSGGNESETDLALLNKLAYWCSNDFQAIDEAFMNSPYFQGKDEEHKTKWQRNDYKSDTINKSISSCNKTAIEDNLIYINKALATNTTVNISETKITHLDIIKEQINTINLDSDVINEMNWIEYTETKNGDKVNYKILCPQLAQFIRNNFNYIFVRNNAKGGILRYFYLNGYYKLVSDDEIKGLIKSCIPLELQKVKDIKEVLDLLYTDLNFVSIERLNADENIINFENGILELDTGELKPHSPSYLSTIRIPCDYNENALRPKTGYFEKYMNDLTNSDEEIKHLILQFMGVSISNVYGHRMKKALIMVGKGDTGKSKIKVFLNSLIGAENCSSVDLKQIEMQFGRIQLLNKRLVGSNDMSFMTIAELETFKKATGDDPIHAEYKGENGIDFIFNGVLWFCCNNLPKFGGDKGDWVYNRIVVIECKNVIAEDKQDKKLVEHLLEEREYIVSLAIKELKRVIANNYKYDIPKSCELLNDNYKVENNSFLRFMKDCVIERPNNKVNDNCTVKRFFDVYCEWAKDNNSGYHESKNDINTILENLGRAEKIKTNGYWYYKDITLNAETKKDYVKVYGYDS